LAVDGAEHPMWELLYVRYEKVIVQEKLYCVEWFTEAKPTTWVQWNLRLGSDTWGAPIKLWP